MLRNAESGASKNNNTDVVIPRAMKVDGEYRPHAKSIRKRHSLYKTPLRLNIFVTRAFINCQV